MIDPSHFAGVAGGSLAIAFGTGCTAGYGFAIRTAYRAVKSRLDEVERRAREEQRHCEYKIGLLEARHRELEDMLLGRRPLGFFSTPVDDPELRRTANSIQGAKP